jgi:GR25 family glycosyltransferase involved in LPS biosynthesis
MDQPNNELFGGVFYINLEHRKDRREQIEGELNKLGLKYERFPAIQLNPGNVGCGLSHLAVMKIAKERNLKNVFIIEDDFQLIVEPAAMVTFTGEKESVKTLMYCVGKSPPCAT